MVNYACAFSQSESGEYFESIIMNNKNLFSFTTGAWCADHAKAVAKDKNQYLQLDLGVPYLIGMVETQGQFYYPNYVSKFALSFSDNGITWKDYDKVNT